MAEMMEDLEDLFSRIEPEPTFTFSMVSKDQAEFLLLIGETSKTRFRGFLSKHGANMAPTARQDLEAQILYFEKFENLVRRRLSLASSEVIRLDTPIDYVTITKEKKRKAAEISSEECEESGVYYPNYDDHTAASLDQDGTATPSGKGGIGGTGGMDAEESHDSYKSEGNESQEVSDKNDKNV